MNHFARVGIKDTVQLTPVRVSTVHGAEENGIPLFALSLQSADEKLRFCWYHRA